MKALFVSMEASLVEARQATKEEQFRLLEERARVSSDILESKNETQSLRSTLESERLEFIKNNEDWRIERRRIIQSINDDKSAILRQKSEISGKIHTLEQLSEELTQRKARETAESEAERALLATQSSLLQRQSHEFHKDMASLRMEKTELENCRTKQAAEYKAFEGKRARLEYEVVEAMKKHEDIGMPISYMLESTTY